ncbi:hypothetical protein BRARA_C04597 [Brassica rapa]|uniref:KIB1-4 beta-propeller domain-containing protein n=1 Tax=Brassica campestris TaxID=3711 RepID=A0A398A721_BRACM|nr:hypothetical protein BRARA_C04597 [Brassica rapa]
MEVTRSGPKRNLHCWSELPLDLMWLVFDRLGFADFERARTDKNYGLLFNPEEKNKFYDTQDLVNDFGKSSCVATYKSWLLMITYTEEVYLYNPYIFDLLTRERINLLSFESDYGFISPVLWIDEKTKDYLVVRMFNEENAVSIRKGDNSWKPITQLQFPCIYECYNMVYKDHKLYCLDHYNLTIFYFSGHVPSQVFEISVDGCVNRTTVAGAIRHLGTIPCKHYLACYKNSMVVTVDGDVLILNSVRESMSYIWDFKIYKMGSLTGSKWEEIFTILLELGITVLAKDIEGIKRNSIYFNGSDSVNPYDENDILIFNLDTKKVEKLNQFVCLSVQCSNARWFLPTFKRE